MPAGVRADEDDSAGGVNEALQARLARLYEEGRQVSDRFRARANQRGWHPFIAADYKRVEHALGSFRRPGLRFLEWGSATGTITIMADMLGLESFGIEIDAELVTLARGLADRFNSSARFAVGSFLPAGYRWTSESGDARLGTIGQGLSGYPQIQLALEDFDVVFGYPWGGEEPIMHDLMRRYGGKEAHLLLHGTDEIEVYRAGKRVA